ncbi:phage tail tube protein [Yersinia enterocolitica]|uniref:phage tail tube protein n=1 Tax=Yersinia enterocolitica TaxID=630 RepID=UPI00155A9E06|nr:phage tail tube protein [Yersinia enterocolitica]MBX9478294.1 phage tail tube protein [Yersinia enterocolitica]MBX9482437.1 phage tail tube protein [Yersinia enterocolitica]NQS93716.1 phage tail tube protein [Yersinia enterocolitica]NQT42856.1 phage tail tube protein [Yersinia enterocolitica]NQU00799.1 phage tail tube protein [Yersinia enterocolitica]
MSNTSNRLAGTAYVTVDGITVMVAGQFKYSPSKVKRETVMGMDGIHGYKETVAAPSISCTIRDSGGVSISDFNDQTNVNIVCELANGKTIIGSGMWSVSTLLVDSTEGTVDVSWEGGSVTEN